MATVEIGEPSEWVMELEGEVKDSETGTMHENQIVFFRFHATSGQNTLIRNNRIRPHRPHVRANEQGHVGSGVLIAFDKSCLMNVLLLGPFHGSDCVIEVSISDEKNFG